MANFTEDETQFVRDNYHTMSITDIGERLGRSRGSVAGYANRIGLTKPMELRNTHPHARPKIPPKKPEPEPPTVEPERLVIQRRRQPYKAGLSKAQMAQQLAEAVCNTVALQPAKRSPRKW